MAISPARTAAFDILLRVETENAYASELLHSALLEKLSPQDRGLATEIVMGTLRWQGRIDTLLKQYSSKLLRDLDVEVLIVLRMAAYQAGYLERVPKHAVVNDAVELVRRARKSSAASFVNAVLRKLPTEPEFIPKSDLESPWSIAHFLSHPFWLVEKWVSARGAERTRAICEYAQQPPEAALRVLNPETAAELQREGAALAPGKLLASARRVVAGDVTKTAAFREGRVQIQDEASQLVALLVGRVEADGRILDCCAAPGGKTAVIAARNPAAKVVAAEIHPHRAELTRQRVRAANVQVITADARTLPRGEGYDRVLADVPCSGTGTLARNPEIKWRLQPEKLAELHALQVAILNAALDQLKPGGQLVYSTCSLEREEDEDVVEEVLRARTGVELTDVREELDTLGDELAWTGESLVAGKFLRTIPGVHPCDGFFAAVLRRV